MGVQISSLLEREETDINLLTGKKIAIDAYNTIYQFISIIRDRFTGELLKDNQGRITSHLSGLLYRFSKQLEIGIKPVMVFDGKPPNFKMYTLEKREKRKKESEEKWKIALKEGKDAKTYAQGTTRITSDVIESSKKLISYMGIPIINAPSEGEATCSFLCKQNIVDLVSSQDYDSILFGAPKLIRNLSLSGKKKVPNKEVWVEVRPEILELNKIKKILGINQEQLILIGMLIGTDYNRGIKGYGPKNALKIVREYKTLDKILEKIKWNESNNPYDILNFFLNPPVTEKKEIKWGKIQSDIIIELLSDDYGFSRDRIEKRISKLEDLKKDGLQSNLGSWLKK